MGAHVRAAAEAGIRIALDLEAQRLEAAVLALRDDPDVEAVHDLRVALRRIRSDFHSLRGSMRQGIVTELDVALREAAAVVRPVREGDVLLNLIEHFSVVESREERQAVLLHLPGDLAAARARLIAYVAEGDVERLATAIRSLENVRILRHRGQSHDPLARLLRQAERRFDRAAAQALVRPSDDARHRVRIRAKRLRYLAEFAAVASPDPWLLALAEKGQRAQALLGRLQDLSVLSAHLAACSMRLPEHARLIVRIEDRVRVERDSALDAWRTFTP